MVLSNLPAKNARCLKCSCAFDSRFFFFNVCYCLVTLRTDMEDCDVYLVL